MTPTKKFSINSRVGQAQPCPPSLEFAARHPAKSAPTIREMRTGECCGTRKQRILGQPIKALVSTSYVEKHNQTMRLQMKRYARLTAAHSKKLENHVHSMALYATWYNFARVNSAVRMSPAMAARITDRLWDIGDIVKLIEEWEDEQLAA